MLCSIYKIINQINGKVYVGQTWKSIRERFAEHKVPSNKGCINLHRALNKYGRNNFIIKLITVCGTQKTADYWEDYFIKRYNSIKQGYNLKGGGSHGHFSDAIKKKISEATKGRPAWNKGKSPSEESRKKMSAWQIGRKLSDEHKTKVSESLKGNKRNLGHKHSDETKAVISTKSKAWKRKPLSEETKAKIATKNTGKKASNETKNKMSLSHKNKTWTLIDGIRVYSRKITE